MMRNHGAARQGRSKGDLEMLPERLLTAEEVAKILNIHVRTLANWRAEGRVDLPWVHVGANIRYDSEDVRCFIERGRIPLTRTEKI